MAYDDAAHLILGYCPVHDEREEQKHPGQIRGLEDEYAQETEVCIGVLPTPDVNERARQSGPEESHGEQGRHAQK